MKKRHDNSEGNTILQTTAHWTCAWGLRWNSAFSESWMSLARFSLPHATLEPGQLMLWAARREFCSPCRSSGLIYYSSHSPLHLLPVCFSDCIRGCRTLLYWPSLLGCRQGRATCSVGEGAINLLQFLSSPAYSYTLPTFQQKEVLNSISVYWVGRGKCFSQNKKTRVPT